MITSNSSKNLQKDNPNNNSITPNSSSLSSVANFTKTWGCSMDDFGAGVAIDSANNVYMAVYTDSYGAGGYDALLVKFNNQGAQEWYRTWGGSNDDEATAVVIDSSGNIFITGSTDSYGNGGLDTFLVKFNSAGTQLWNVTWGGTSDDAPNNMAIDSLNNIYITGHTYSFPGGSNDAFLLKYSDSGVLIWNTTWGGPDDDSGYAVATDSNNNVYMTGHTYSFSSNPGATDDVFLVKYNGAGVQQWNTTWGSNGNDGPRDMVIDSSGNIYTTGGSQFVNNEGFLAKFNSTGGLQWYKLWEENGHSENYGIGIDSANNIYVDGRTYSYNWDVYLLKYSSNGTMIGSDTWGGTNDDEGRNLAINSANDVYIVGWTNDFGAGGYDAFLAMYTGDSLSNSSNPNTPNNSNNSNNPFENLLNQIPGFPLGIFGFISIMTISLIILKNRKDKKLNIA